MTIYKVFGLITEKYEWAKGQDWIRNPIAWALYQVWKEVDNGE